MNPPLPSSLVDLPALLRGEPEATRQGIESAGLRPWAVQAACVFLGAGLFGAAVGSWTSPQQALYAALKLPLILFLTGLGNGLLNAVAAPLLGLNLPAGQTLRSILLSFAMAAIILGGFSPLLGFLVWNTPSSRGTGAFGGHSLLLVAQAGMIAVAGVAANLRLWQLLRRQSRDAATATRVMLFWLGGNLLLGSQLSWVFRPIVGSPNLPVQFLRGDPMHGSFYESLFHAFHRLFQP